MSKVLLEAKGIDKIFPAVKALDNVDLTLRAGEVHVLVGENGAGKSTLAKVILGVHRPEAGEIWIDGEQVKLNSPKEAIAHGITAVYQELTMVPHLDAAQNIFLNREPRFNGTPFVNKKKMYYDAQELLNKLDCSYINIKKHTKYLSVAEQQMVEIAKALSFNPKIIVFDEPTATLSDREVESLFTQIRQLKAAGLGIIYVSHRMKELPVIGDVITVMRDGKYIDTVDAKTISEEKLVNMMVGRDISQVYTRNRNAQQEEALRAESLCDKSGKVQNCGLHIKRGEIVGLAGLVGAGRSEFARLMFGIDKLASGKVFVNGTEVKNITPIAMVANKMGFLPEDRKGVGLALKAPISWNVVAVSLKKFFPGLFLSSAKNDEIATKYVKELRVATPDVVRAVRSLSGGNQQKVVLSKWLSADSNIIIFDEPTRGIDVGAKLEIYNLLDKLAGEGKAILMISSEMAEIMGMSDRLYIMREGKFVAEYACENFDAEEIGAKMLGIGVDE